MFQVVLVGEPVVPENVAIVPQLLDDGCAVAHSEVSIPANASLRIELLSEAALSSCALITDSM